MKLTKVIEQIQTNEYRKMLERKRRERELLTGCPQPANAGEKTKC